MAYRFLVIDVDGTLLNGRGTISEEDKNAIRRVREKGIAVAISTGRVTQACKPIIKELGLEGSHIFFDGSLILDISSGKEVYSSPLDKEIVRELVGFSRSQDIYLELYSAEELFIERFGQASVMHYEFFGLKPKFVDFDSILDKERIIKAEVITARGEESKIKPIKEYFGGELNFSIARTPALPQIDFVNLVSPEVSKGRALEQLAAYLGVLLEETVAIGDGPNDISLLKTAGLGIAMGNAPLEVKRVAQYVTADVDHGGVAKAIAQFF